MPGLSRALVPAQESTRWSFGRLLLLPVIQKGLFLGPKKTRKIRHFFFCSNALMALARSLCKCLLAVLITASEAGQEKLDMQIRASPVQPSNPHVKSAPTSLTAQPTTLQDHTYERQTRMSGAHLRPSQLNLRPFTATPTTLKPACQERTYDPHSSTYDPSRPHLRLSNPHVRSAPTTLTAQPTTLQGHTYDPQTRMSEGDDDPFRTLAEYKGISQSAWEGGKAESL